MKESKIKQNSQSSPIKEGDYNTNSMMINKSPVKDDESLDWDINESQENDIINKNTIPGA